MINFHGLMNRKEIPIFRRAPRGYYMDHVNLLQPESPTEKKFDILENRCL